MPALPPRRSIAARVGAVAMPCALLLAGIPARAQETAASRPHPHPHPVLHAVRTHAHAILHPHGHRAAHAARHASPPPPPPPPAARPAPPPVPAAPPKGSSTGLPLPRFASLRADAVNLRSGPGTRYPIQWVYKRRDLPVEIEREFDVWRLVQDSDGVKGWVHQATLVGTRSFVVLAALPAADAAAASGDASGPPGGRTLRAEPRPDAAVVAILRPGVIGRIRSCAAGADWCRVSVHTYSGWLSRSAFWGMLPDEAILPP